MRFKELPPHFSCFPLYLETKSKKGKSLVSLHSRNLVFLYFFSFFFWQYYKNELKVEKFQKHFLIMTDLHLHVNIQICLMFTSARHDCCHSALLFSAFWYWPNDLLNRKFWYIVFQDLKANLGISKVFISRILRLVFKWDMQFIFLCNPKNHWLMFVSRKY